MQQLHWYGGKLKDNNTDEVMAVNPSSSKGKGSKGDKAKDGWLSKKGKGKWQC